MSQQRDKNKLNAMEMLLWRRMIKIKWTERKSDEGIFEKKKKIGEGRSIMNNINQKENEIYWEHYHNDFLNNISERGIMGR